MSRRSFIHNEHEAWERHRQRDVDVERWNPLENASTGGVLEFEGSGGVKAGLYEVRANGFITTWNGEARTVNSLLSSINNTASGAADAAQSAMARANQAWESQALKPTTLWVQARLDALSGRIDRSATSGTVDALAQRVASLEASRVQMVQLFSQIIVAMEVQPGHTRPTPIRQG